MTSTYYSKVENFYPIVVDDFFDDPEILINYGKSLSKKAAHNGHWPGMRTDELWKIDEELHNAILTKIMSCYFNLDHREITWKNSGMNFQEIPRYSEIKNDVKNKGWIHRDSYTEDSPYELAGLIYLTPKIDPDSGTSLFKLKDSVVESGLNIFETFNQDQANMLYKSVNLGQKSNKFDEQKFIKNWTEQDELFIEKTRFQNIFNRVIMYDAAEWHRANSFFNDDGEDARLTLVFFVGGINEHALKRVKLDKSKIHDIIRYNLIR
tara:strand:+ start:50 stop:844 length:795 start_codon:yes stop_codon:yes gene_type:complete